MGKSDHGTKQGGVEGWPQQTPACRGSLPNATPKPCFRLINLRVWVDCALDAHIASALSHSTASQEILPKSTPLKNYQLQNASLPIGQRCPSGQFMNGVDLGKTSWLAAHCGSPPGSIRSELYGGNPKHRIILRFHL